MNFNKSIFKDIKKQEYDKKHIEEGALKLIKLSRIKANEKVVIITDEELIDIAQIIASSASEITNNVVVMWIPIRKYDGEEPPEIVSNVMKEADVVFTPTSISIAWSQAVRNVRNMGLVGKTNGRVMLMTDYDYDTLTGKALRKYNFESNIDLCERIGVKLSRAKVIKIETALGTNIIFNKGERKANLVTSVLSKAGDLGSAPNQEVNVAPMEGTTNGILVVDGSIPYKNIGVLSKPIKLTFKDGYVIKIEGDELGEEIKEYLDSFDDKRVYNAAELGIGLNTFARLDSSMLEAEGVYGTIQFAIGRSDTFGGETWSPIHWDFMVQKPTIYFDENIIMKNGELVDI